MEAAVARSLGAVLAGMRVAALRSAVEVQLRDLIATFYIRAAIPSLRVLCRTADAVAMVYEAMVYEAYEMNVKLRKNRRLLVLSARVLYALKIIGLVVTGCQVSVSVCAALGRAALCSATP
jgi:hypothetical protein